ncbi:hypothetical protein M7I_2523 [Glarea lozoyensis 74030]|uniref:Uncharacterized protein n=1 Tax=Glarea lozoyensis (strain ATCC 74030 / MF5533) TaxID=1104152 RepID=H0EJ01_GLAL7|nr:hypothetical protein M7I_2523 [Glarea lozoyensis 74030]
MSFGWSFGDVVAGINLIFKVYNAVSDGPRNSKVEASQFFADFSEVIVRLDKWEARKAACDKDQNLRASHEELKELCTTFIKRHFRIIQQANPDTRTGRPGRSTWIKKVSFTGSQVASLYNQVQWPFERKELSRLREKLQFFLQLSAWDVALDTNQIVNEFKSSHAELLSSNLKLVSSHLDLVSRITFNLKRVTHPLESGSLSNQIDYPMLRHLDQALRPPEPLRAIHAPPQLASLPWHGLQHGEDAELSAVSVTHHYDSDMGDLDESEMRGLLSRRLDNMSMRVRRVETLESLPEDASADGISTTQDLMTRLRNMRGQIGGAVGISEPSQSHEVIEEDVVDPGTALQTEIEAWNKLEERIEREILHPGRLLTPGPDTRLHMEVRIAPEAIFLLRLAHHARPPNADVALLRRHLPLRHHRSNWNTFSVFKYRTQGILRPQSFTQYHNLMKEMCEKDIPPSRSMAL